MQNVRPAPGRLLGSLLSTIVWVAVLACLWGGFCQLLPWMQETRSARVWVEARQDQLTVGGGYVLGLLGFLLAFLRSLSLRNTRYEAGATDLTVRSGGLWRTTRTIPIVEILRVETSSGPLMRLLGLEDLKVYVPGEALPVSLYGLAAGGEFRKHLLARRESLREAVLSGDLSVGKTPQDMILERLDRVLERIEQHLPASGGGAP